MSRIFKAIKGLFGFCQAKRCRSRRAYTVKSKLKANGEIIKETTQKLCEKHIAKLLGIIETDSDGDAP